MEFIRKMGFTSTFSSAIMIALFLLLSSAASCSSQLDSREVASRSLPEGYSAIDSSPGSPPQADSSARLIQAALDNAVQFEPSAPAKPVGSEVFINTSDGMRLAATVYSTNKYSTNKDNKDTGVILLHMLGKDRKSWDPIITNIATRHSVIAIDLRGHGQSSGVLRKFTEEDFRSMVNDVAAARKTLGTGKVGIVGASIGANAGLRYASIDPSVKTVIALSPGLDYRGVRIDDVMQYLDRPVLVIASKGDQYSYNTLRKLSEMNKKVETDVLESDRHGTDMFGIGKGVESRIYKWLNLMLSDES